ncbi:MAG: hypothetical protein COC06_03225 [Bacteroidales bacterium]|nr:MAG: hypothetical protein COC06_03225 [Bacteroidales bacterium]
MKKEFEFEQKKKLKEEIAKNKVHLLNAVEELNHRLWNFTQNVGENWHKISENDWFKGEQYYINSFVYRFLVFIHWTLKTERDTISVDSTIADKADIRFLKYIKTFKDIFTDAELLSELGYSRNKNHNHFYKNDLIGYCKWVVENRQVRDFDDFEIKLKYEYASLQKVIEYFSGINDDDLDKNLNILRCTHLLAISFLNDFGHTYQKTENKKVDKIAKHYKSKIMIKKGFAQFITKSKLDNEMKNIMRKIK